MADEKNKKGSTSADEMIAALAEGMGISHPKRTTSPPEPSTDSPLSTTPSPPPLPHFGEASAESAKPSPTPAPEQPQAAPAIPQEQSPSPEANELEKLRLELEMAKLQLEKARLEKERLELEQNRPSSKSTGFDHPPKASLALDVDLPFDVEGDNGLDEGDMDVGSSSTSRANKKFQRLAEGELDDVIDDTDALESRSNRKMFIGLTMAFAIILGGAVAAIYGYAQHTIMGLEAEDIEHAGMVDVIRHFDTYRQDLGAAQRDRHHQEQRARVRLYGHLRVQSEPTQADVFIKCSPMDERCNNAGTADNPQWSEHFVRDDQIGDKACQMDKDCQECREASSAELADPNFDQDTLCRLKNAKCTDNVCRLAMRTATTIQSLYIGTLLSLDQERQYHITIEKEGWLPEEYTVTAKDWTMRLDTREESDRAFALSFNLKPDPDAPEEIREKVAKYLQEKADIEARAEQTIQDYINQ